MRSTPALLLLSSLLTFTAAHAAGPNQPGIFKVIKPHNPQNIVQVDVKLNNTNSSAANFCKLTNLENLDFYYLMDGVTPQRSQIEDTLRARFKKGEPKPGNKAACPQNPPEGTKCSAIYVKLDEIGWVSHNLADPVLVVKAVSSNGRCGVAAFLDSGEKVVVVKRVIAKGARTGVGIFPPSASIRIDSVAIEPTEGDLLGPWPCRSRCNKRLYMSGEVEDIR